MNLRNRAYYWLKPFIPRTSRLAIRSWFARRKRPMVGDRWPILPGSERPPDGWPGWPDGKKFALVLTHDVEGQEGLNRCQAVADLEMQLGFRSSFNFIPQGDYTVPESLRTWLTSNGFEIGVHDLRHDGKLFYSHTHFRQQVDQINRYARAWGAAGFRAGFMLRQLDWLHDLQIQYDASTFDTDPFEPQSDGVGTIFPFWVPRPEIGDRRSEVGGRRSGVATQDGSTSVARSSTFTPDHGSATRAQALPTSNSRPGYVELPYTLPQDSTLFFLLKEKHPDIWMQKLDWIAKHGGMALVNVHPDYMRFKGDLASAPKYSAEFYARFLEYARRKYGDIFWQPTAADMARFVRERHLGIARKPKRVCMISYSFYTSDARVRRYAEALAERGDHVDVLALRRSQDLPGAETVSNVNLVRLQTRRGKQEQSRLSYLRPILRFFCVSSAWLTREHLRNPYDFVHVHNVPDFLVFAAWFPKLTGARVILDIHDIVPEFYASKFGTDARSAGMAALKWMERASARFADRVIISNHLWLEKYAARTRANGKCSVFINNVDSRIFQPRPRSRNDGKLIILFPGGLQWHQGVDIAIRAFAQVRADVPNAEFHIYGDGNVKQDLAALTTELGLDAKVRFFDPLPVHEVANLMANADLGVVPKRADGFGNEAYSTKIMEFMSVGVPVVVSNTKIDQYYFDNSVVRFFESGNPNSLANSILEMLQDPGRRSGMAARAFDYVAQNSWETRKHDYLHLVDSLVERLPEVGRIAPPRAAGPVPNEVGHVAPSRADGPIAQ